MLYKNALINGVLTDIEVENGKIVSMNKTEGEGIDLGGRRVFAGLIDTHIHGCLGYDATEDTDKLEEMSCFLAKNGTTSWLPTTMTMSYEMLKKAVNRDISGKGAEVLGFHLEGPYISSKYKGAQNEKYIQSPNIEEFRTFRNVKKITVAPEMPGAMEFIRQCDCCVSLGHTDASYEVACEAFRNGAKCLTHTFNAMPPFHHRNPGPIGAAIECDGYVEVITDGNHVHKNAVMMLYRTFGPNRMIIISDALRPTGLPDGVYTSGGLRIHLKDSLARLDDGTIAGSSSTLLKCVKTAISFGIPVSDAFKMASETAAKSIGIENKGVLRVGADADFIAVDDDLNLTAVVIAGELQ